MTGDDSAFIRECARVARNAFFEAVETATDQTPPPPWETLTLTEQWAWMAAARGARGVREPR